MIVYDCDDQEQFAILERAVASLPLDNSNLLQAFAPDTPLEAANRGFKDANIL